MRPNDEQIVLSLIKCGSARAAARELGCCDTTIRRRLADPEFREKYEGARRELLEEGLTELRGLVGEAVKTVGEILANGYESSSVRLNAASLVLRYALRDDLPRP